MEPGSVQITGAESGPSTISRRFSTSGRQRAASGGGGHAAAAERLPAQRAGGGAGV